MRPFHLKTGFITYGDVAVMRADRRNLRQVTLSEVYELSTNEQFPWDEETSATKARTFMVKCS